MIESPTVRLRFVQRTNELARSIDALSADSALDHGMKDAVPRSNVNPHLIPLSLIVLINDFP